MCSITEYESANSDFSLSGCTAKHLTIKTFVYGKKFQNRPNLSQIILFLHNLVLKITIKH